MMSIEAHTAIIQRYYAMHNAGTIDNVEEIVTADYENGSGPAGFLATMQYIRTIFPDIHWTIDELIVQGNTVAVRWTGGGTHQGEFLGVAATGKQVHWSGMSFHHLVDGKVSDDLNEWDHLSFLRQTDAVQASA